MDMHLGYTNKEENFYVLKTGESMGILVHGWGRVNVFVTTMDNGEAMGRVDFLERNAEGSRLECTNTIAVRYPYNVEVNNDVIEVGVTPMKRKTYIDFGDTPCVSVTIKRRPGPLEVG